MTCALAILSKFLPSVELVFRWGASSPWCILTFTEVIFRVTHTNTVCDYSRRGVRSGFVRMFAICRTRAVCGASSRLRKRSYSFAFVRTRQVARTWTTSQRACHRESSHHVEALLAKRGWKSACWFPRVPSLIQSVVEEAGSPYVATRVQCLIHWFVDGVGCFVPRVQFHFQSFVAGLAHHREALHKITALVPTTHSVT